MIPCEDTIVVFTSDNGPSIQPNQDVGSSGLLRGSKHTTWEGGLHVPFIVWAPHQLPARKTCMDVGTTMDLFTTLTALAGASVPGDRIIDGENIMGAWLGEGGHPHDPIYFYHGDRLAAVRLGKYKLHLWKNVPESTFGKWVKCDPYELYDVEYDPSEKYNIAHENVELVSRIEKEVLKFKDQLRSLS